MDSRKLALLCGDLADNKKAEDIAILDVRDLSSVTDYFVIASGTSEPHLRAIVDEISDRLREEQLTCGPRGLTARCKPPGLCWIILMRHCPRHAHGRARALRPGNTLGGRTTRHSEEKDETCSQGRCFKIGSRRYSARLLGQNSPRLLWALRRRLVRHLHHFIQYLAKFLQAGRGNDDGIAPSAHVLGDAQKTSARVFLQRQHKGSSAQSESWLI